MHTESVVLEHAGGAPRAVTLRAPCGRDEIAVEGVDTRAAVELLDRLLGGTGAARMAAADRDALFAAIHRRCWGDRIVATLTCGGCREPFDLSFDLSAVQRSLRAGARDWRPSGDGRVVHGSGAAFIVPSAQDEIEAAAGHPRDALARLAASCGAAGDPAPVNEALEQGAPIIDLDLNASCPSCGHEQVAQFDIQSFVLQRLINEREPLLAEVHLLATAYGWSLDEILVLSRDSRRALAAMVSDSHASTPARTRYRWTP